jgi:vancomycin permeability regulator SanA
VSWLQVIPRGTALFVGLFSVANSIIWAAGSRRGEDLWWIDMSFLPRSLSAVLMGLCAVALVAYGVEPRMGEMRRLLTIGACLALALVAVLNALAFYSAWRGGGFTPAVPVPFSIVVAVLFALLAWTMWTGAVANGGVVTLRGTVAVAAVMAMLFPLAHIGFFGTTDYRAPADAAVVLGARVHSGGLLSQSLEDRVATAAGLYREGQVPLLVMSGGVGTEGIDEAAAMKRRAVELGVPPSAVLLDSRGVNTDATVANTTELLGERGLTRVLVVSQFYHLPRIKMAYRAAGWQVRTVPAQGARPIAKTPQFVVREIPGFWVYWARAAWRDLTRG